ncbi:protein of unknown function [Micromonospora rhizosphaerae]|uniref:DUF4926 domain-containing protein n=1 Tax=Micromonospora rhizosphaerae TaxID=568872 RepID=A0A1C6SN40_9ACTN|nr:DUF4926 domain-containing protein [Micromonospora rhizosphaerae]SCL30890.1 protein of unknown function [Micromonospora rhizosphaerae]
MNLYDVVELISDVPEENLPAGSIGTIVHIFTAPEQAYEVEFADSEGRTLATVALKPDDVRPSR